MKRIHYIYLGLLLGCLVAAPAIRAADASSGGIQWLTYEQASKQVHDPSRKYFLFFYTDWCTYCHKLEQNTFADKAVADYINQNFIPVKINSERNPKLAARFRISGVPNLRFLTPAGKDIAQWPGYIEPADFLPLLKYIHTDSYLKMAYRDFLKQQ